jgi:hypothetical protein
VGQGHANTARSDDEGTKHAAIYQKSEEPGETPDSPAVLTGRLGLETDLGGDLEATGATASQKGIANPNVTGRR